MKPPINENELLRAMHHDMLNRLQVMQMNLDLGRTDQVRRLIGDYSLRCQHFFHLNNAAFQQVSTWLETLTLHHPEVKATYEVKGTGKATAEQDTELVQLFDSFFHQIKSHFTPYHDQLMHMTFDVASPITVSIKLIGNWCELEDMVCEEERLFTKEIVEYTKTSLKLNLVERVR